MPEVANIFLKKITFLCKKRNTWLPFSKSEVKKEFKNVATAYKTRPQFVNSSHTCCWVFQKTATFFQISHGNNRIEQSFELNFLWSKLRKSMVYFLIKLQRSNYSLILLIKWYIIYMRILNNSKYTSKLSANKTIQHKEEFREFDWGALYRNIYNSSSFKLRNFPKPLIDDDISFIIQFWWSMANQHFLIFLTGCN